MAKRILRNEEAEERFFTAVLSLQGIEECRAFFADICTDAEVGEMSRRL